MSESDDDLRYVSACFSEEILGKVSFLESFGDLENKAQAVAEAVAIANWFDEAKDNGAKIVIDKPRGSRSRITTIWKTAEQLGSGASDTKLVSMRLREETCARIERLHEKTGLKNKAIVIANSVAFVADIINLEQQGAKVYAEYPNGDCFKPTTKHSNNKDEFLTISDHKLN